jgi:hypothetical protein
MTAYFWQTESGARVIRPLSWIEITGERYTDRRYQTRHKKYQNARVCSGIKPAVVASFQEHFRLPWLRRQKSISRSLPIAYNHKLDFCCRKPTVTTISKSKI